MEKRLRSRASTIPRFVWLQHYLLDSAAFAALSPNAVKMLLVVWRRHNGVNNGEITFGVREGAQYGLSPSVTARALDELERLGFLVCTRPGAFHVKRLARTWRLTGERAGEKPSTRDFMRWTPSKE